MSKLLIIMKYSIGWPFSILALLFMIYKSYLFIPSLILRIEKANILMLIYAVLCFLIYFLLRTFLWKNILLYKGCNIPLRDSAFLWSQSEIRRYIPIGFISFLSRALLFSNTQISKETVISAMLIESQVIVISTLILSIFGLSEIPNINLYLLFLLRAGIIGFTFFWIFKDLFIKYIKNVAVRKILLIISPSFYWQSNASLVCIGVSTFFFFGLGTYFSISSLIFINPTMWISLLGFFTFSFLIGYLAIFAPSGIGVREWIITIGISNIAGNLAGFLSIFPRIIVIITEIIFLFLCFIWTNSYILHKKELFIYKNRFLIISIIFFLAYCAYFTTASFARHDNFFSGKFDLGNMDQVVWNTAKGKIFQFSDPDGIKTISRLAFHADFFLVLLSPFYWITETPKILLLLQTIALGSGSIFIFFIAKKLIKNEIAACICSIIYLLNPSMHYANLYDFHSATFATTFILASYYYFLIKKRGLFFLFLILAALTKEHVWIIVGLLSIYSAIKSPWKKISIFFSIFSFITFYILVWNIIPLFRNSNHFALSFYSSIGNSPTQIIKNSILSPSIILPLLFQQNKIIYLLQLFIPVGFISFFSPLILIFSLPDLLINMLSNNNQFTQIYYQYTATITPFIFISAIYGILSFKRFFRKISVISISFFILIMTIVGAYNYGPLPGAKNPNIKMFTDILPYKDYINYSLGMISPYAKIAATNNIGAHLTHRDDIYTIPIGIDDADTIVFLFTDKFSLPSPKILRDISINLKTSNKYNIIAEKEDFIILQKKLY